MHLGPAACRTHHVYTTVWITKCISHVSIPLTARGHVTAARNPAALLAAIVHGADPARVGWAARVARLAPLVRLTRIAAAARVDAVLQAVGRGLRQALALLVVHGNGKGGVGVWAVAGLAPYSEPNVKLKQSRGRMARRDYLT